MQHGQKVEQPPRALLAAAGYDVAEIAEGHLCCGSAGTYNVLQPEIATRLRERKLAHIARTGADVVATGNIGCITQLAAGAGVPVVHTVELLDWATGGPQPPALANFAARPASNAQFRTEVRDVIDPKQLLEQVLGSNVAGNARVCRSGRSADRLDATSGSQGVSPAAP